MYYLDIDHDFDDVDFADEVLRAIEKDYGRSIQRIPKFNRMGLNRFAITIVFTDFRILEAELLVVDVCGIPTVQVNGVYH